MNGERFKLASGIKAKQVGFKGAADAQLEVVAGRVHFAIVGLASSLPFIKDGRLIALAMGTPQRSSLLPDVPTIAETLPGYARDGSHSMVAPTGTPRPILTKISQDVKRVLEMPDVKQRLENIDFVAAPTTPEEHDRIIRADLRTFTGVVQVAGLAPQRDAVVDASLRDRGRQTRLNEEESMFRIACASLFAALIALPAPSAAAAAEGYPQKPIRLIIPFAPGGGTDLLARIMQEKLDRLLGVSVIVDNRAGGAGTIGFTLTARAAPDGYTFMVTSASYTFAPGLYKDLPFDPIKDFRPLSMLTTQPLILGVHPSMPVKSVKDLLALARQRPGKILYGGAGVGSNLHMTTELFKYMAKIDLTQVQYKGGGPALDRPRDRRSAGGVHGRAVRQALQDLGPGAPACGHHQATIAGRAGSADAR